MEFVGGIDESEVDDVVGDGPDGVVGGIEAPDTGNDEDDVVGGGAVGIVGGVEEGEVVGREEDIVWGPTLEGKEGEGGSKVGR